MMESFTTGVHPEDAIRGLSRCGREFPPTKKDDIDWSSCDVAPSPVPKAMAKISALDCQGEYAPNIRKAKPRKIGAVATSGRICHFYIYRWTGNPTSVGKQLARAIRSIDGKYVCTDSDGQWPVRDTYVCAITHSMPFERIRRILKQHRRNTEGPYWGAGRELAGTGSGEVPKRCTPKLPFDPLLLLSNRGENSAAMLRRVTEYDPIDLYPDAWDYDLKAWQKCCRAWPEFARCYKLLLDALGEAQMLHCQGKPNELEYWARFEAEVTAWICGVLNLQSPGQVTWKLP